MFSSNFDVIGFESSAMRTKKKKVIVGCENVHISLVLIGFSDIRGDPWDPGEKQGWSWAVWTNPQEGYRSWKT